MRVLFTVAALIVGVGLLSACGKPASQSSQPSAGATSEPVPPTPTPLTDAQKKAMLETLPAAYQNADLDNGQAKFALCKSCHTVVQGGGNMVGPNLYGVFGRKAGTSPAFAYSDGLKSSGIVWDAASLDKWITNPRALVPGTKMTYIGMSDPKDRTDVIAYLKIATSTPPS